MKMSDFLDAIVEFSSSIHGCRTGAILTQVAPLEQRCFPQPFILYVGTLSKTVELGVFEECHRATFALIRDCDFQYPQAFAKDNCVLEYPSSTHPDALMRRIQDCFSRTGGSAWPANGFAEMLLGKTSLSRVINTAASHLNVPLIVGSPGGRKIYAISQSIQPEAPDATWLDIVRTGEFSVEQHCKDMERNYGRDNADSTPYFVYYPDDDKWRIMSKIYSDGKYLGTLHTYDVPFERVAKVDTRKFQLLSSIIAHYISATPSVRLDSYMPKDQRAVLLGDLLDENYGYADMRNDSALYKRILSSDAVCLMNIPLMDYKYQNNLDGQLIGELSALYPHSLPFYYRRNVLVLINLDKDRQCCTENAGQLMALMERHALIAAVSDEFSSLTDIIRYYHQTNRILAIAAKMQISSRLLNSADFKFYELALAAADGHNVASLQNYCLPVLIKIREDAKKAGTEDLYNTLRKYIYTNKSLSQTAARLFLHKSTVAYRITNIKDRYNLPLDDMNDVFRLYYSFQLLDILDADARASQSK